jgi:hypothetical protein
MQLLKIETTAHGYVDMVHIELTFQQKMIYQILDIIINEPLDF